MAGYIKFSGIKGSTKRKAYEAQSQIISFSKSIQADTSKPGVDGSPGGDPSVSSMNSPGWGRGTASFGAIEIVKEVDKTSLVIAESVFKRDDAGRPPIFETVEISFETTQGDEWLSFVLRDVYVRNYSLSVTEEGVENFSLMFKAIEAKYHEYGATGPQKGSSSMEGGVISYQWDI